MLRRIGVRVHDYGADDIDNLSKRIEEDGYTTIHLAPQKAIYHIKEANGIMTQKDADTTKDTLSGRGIDISVLGCYLNYAHPDEDIRNKNIEKAKMYIRLAKAFGCRVVGTETGSLDPNYKAHVDNHGEQAYSRFKDALNTLTVYAKEHDVDFAVEAVSHHIINTPKRMRRLIDDLGYGHLKVICDINNIITPENYEQQDELINMMFDLLEDQIEVVHIKDFNIEGDSSKQKVPLSTGKLNLELIAKRVKASPKMIDVIAEDMRAEDMSTAQKILETYFA